MEILIMGNCISIFYNLIIVENYGNKIIMCGVNLIYMYNMYVTLLNRSTSIRDAFNAFH